MNPTQLGPYPIEREVGRGGMGVVYLGRDPRLKRPVAIKVLPESFAFDPDRLARFEREARLLASLTHPNIAGIYGLEEAEGKRFLTLEYVEGETLAEHLERGALSIEETLDVGRQIASALEAAHEAGIVHRDLKPGNVKLTPSGDVKVLDFGLAKGAASGADSSPDLSKSPTLTHAPTGAGVILGTAAYMSPEQARGKIVDRRTDIWSFGCVLYECLTGAQAFAGETASDMIALILQGEPDWSRLPARTPEKLRALIGRCLEKDARRRLRDIGDARIELEELQGGRVSSAVRAGAMPAAVETGAARPVRRLRTIAAAVGLVAVGAVAGAAVWSSRQDLPEAPVLRFTVPAPPGVDLLNDSAEQTLSPDGKTLAFAATDTTGQIMLWVRPLGDFSAHELPGTRNGDQPFWSPDSRQVGFFADGKLKRVQVDGGTPAVVCDAATGRGATWSVRDVIVFSGSPTGPLFQVKVSGGTPQAVTVVDSTRGENAHRWPCFLPDGEHFLYAALPAEKGEFRTYVGSITSMERTPLLSVTRAPIYAAPGYLIYSRNEALQAQRFDPGGRKLIGDPFPLGDPPGQTFFTASPGASVSATGVLAWVSAGKPENRVVWLDRDGRERGRVDIPLDRWSIPVLSPDGRRATLEQDTPTGAADIWVVDLERATANRLTYQTGRNMSAFWSPDGKWIAYGSTRNGPRDLYVRPADGSGTDRLLYASSVPFKDVTDWSPDGEWILFNEIGGTDGWNLLLIPAAGGTPTPYVVTPFNEQNGRISPDGRWVLYISDESGNPQAYVQSFPRGGNKQQVTKSGALFGAWVKGGREILLTRPDLMTVSVPVEPGADIRFGSPRDLFRMNASTTGGFPAPDGERFLVTMPAEETEPGVSIAVNWQAGRGR